MISGLNSDGLAATTTGAKGSRSDHRALLRLTAGAAAVVAIGGVMTAPALAASATRTPVSYALVSRAPHLPSGARTVSAASTSQVISGSVALAPRDPAALQKAALAVSNPRSADYRDFIPKGTFAARFGPTAATISAVRSALTASHLTVTSVSSNGLLVHFSGSIGDAESAFRTKIANVRLASGRTGRETTTSVSFPASIASQVTSVVGLNTLARPAATLEHGTHAAAVKPAGPSVGSLTHATGAPDACAAASGAAAAFGGLTDDQIAHAYGVDGLYTAGDTGAGQSIAVFELEPFSTTDLAAFDTCYYGSAQATQMASRLKVKAVDGGSGTGEGSGESILDVDDVSGIAPGANIDVYEAPNSATGSLDEYNAIIAADTDKEITTSWAYCELDEQQLEPGYTNVENQLFEQAALQGQTLFASSGDAGSDACAYHAAAPVAPTLSGSDPASQPFVTAVGGTTITDSDNPPTENVWNDGTDFGAAGGGVSSVWGSPSWQQQAITTADRTAAAAAVTTGGQTPCAQSTDGTLCREVPDVSAQADEFTGAITVYAAEFAGWTTFGGTSSSTPLWAAMFADINASAGCASGPGIGFASPALYAVAATPAGYASSFTDVKTGNNDQYNLFNGSLFAAGTGYDMASGLGSPIVVGASGQAGLAAHLCALTAAPATPPTVTSISPTSVSTSSPPASLTVTGTNLAGVTAVSVGGYLVPAADIHATATTVTVSPVPTAAQAGTAGLGPQDGSGRAIISLTDGTTTLTSAVNVADSLYYVDGAAADTPSVSGVGPFGGAQTGTNTVTIFGSGFVAGDTVTVGGVSATGVSVLTPTTLTATLPAYSSGVTTCATGDDPATDVCQSQVVVSNAAGTEHSATDPILPPYKGASYFGLSGGTPPPDCVTGGTCEFVPSTTEYDYLATPTITSVTTTSPGDSTVWASEAGTTIATIEGSGFDVLGLQWLDIGTPTVAANADFGLLSSTPTKIQVVLSPEAPKTAAAAVEPLAENLYVQTLQGVSAPFAIKYAGTPTVKSVSPPAVSDLGGDPLAISGKGFQGVDLADGGQLAYQYLSLAGQTNQIAGYTASSDTAIAVSKTPESNPGAYLLTVCTVTACSSPATETAFNDSVVDFYQPGNPVVTGVSVKSGPASGGTAVKITGRNLSDALIVKFGKVTAEAASAPAFLTNGSSTEVDATAPPGVAGSKADITVTTVESLYASGGKPSPTTTAATFSYVASVPSAPTSVAASVSGKSIKVTWKAPASTGGHAILRYRVSAVSVPDSDKKGAKKPPTVEVTTKKGSTRSATIPGLRAGWYYTVTVRAVNSLGKGLVAEAPKIYFIHDPA